MGYLSLSWISVKMSPCQPCPLIFMTSLCCFYEYLHLYPQGPSTQGTFTQNISHQDAATSLSASCHLLHVPAIHGPFLHVGFHILSPEFRLLHPTAPEAERNPLFPGNPLPFLHRKQVTVGAPIFFRKLFITHVGGAPKTLGPRGHLLSPL